MFDLRGRLLEAGGLSVVRFALHPQLIWLRDVNSGESLCSLIKMNADPELLLRWTNYHLQRAGSVRYVTQDRS